MKLIFIFSISILTAFYSFGQKPRARGIGIPFDGIPGQNNSITDIPGVEVGYSTIISGKGDDLITTNAGNDVIDAGAGSDTVISDAGSDLVTGGAGSDTFELDLSTSRISDTLTITDLQNEDSINIKNAGYNSSSNWVDDLQVFYNSSLNQTILSNSNNGVLSDFIIKNEYITPGLLSMTMEDSKNKTVMTIKSFKPDLGLNDEIFSESFLIKI